MSENETKEHKFKTTLNVTVVNTPPAAAKTCCQDDACCSIDTAEQETVTTLTEKPGQTKEFRIGGMDCPACAGTIEKSVRNIQHIRQATVNYSTGKMQVVSDDTAALEQVSKEVRKLGYTVEPIISRGNMRTYRIDGMDCGSCAATIENHLNTLPDVKDVRVNFSTGKMHIEHEGGTDQIIQEVAKAGYRAALVSNRKEAAEVPRASTSYSLIVMSGLLLALGFLGSHTGVSEGLIRILYVLAMFIGGYKPAKSAFYAIRSKSLDMNVLMTAAAIGAAVIGLWLEGATVVWLFALGNILQTKSIEKTRNSIRSLMNLAPPEAWVKNDEALVRKPVEEVSVGERIVIKPGEMIPLDGEMVQGSTSVNQAPITGESIPVDKQEGDMVYAGTVNEWGSIEVRVTKLAEDTAIAKIIHLVEEAQEKKAPTQAFVDQFARIYTPIVFALAMAVMILPPLFHWGSWEDWFYKGLELLVVACPCALVISTPVAIVSAIGNAAKNGVLIKGGTFLETAGAITAIAFDKTGTLTEGKPKVSQVVALEGNDAEWLSIARSIEEHSRHPIAQAIINYAERNQIPARQGTEFKAIVGKGAQASIQGIVYFAGNLKWFKERNIPTEPIEARAHELQHEGNTIVVIGSEQKVMGMIAVADSIRGNTKKALQSLKLAGVQQIVMLTGDNEGTARNISAQAGVDRTFAELLPEDKVKAVQQLQSEGKKVAMIGDGINDTPALAAADLGIAMGGAGTDMAMETADIVLMADNLEKLPHTIKLSRMALRIIKQNIWFSLVVKLVALILIFPGWLTLWIAVLSDTGAALVVILNSMRLLRYKEVN